MLAMWNLLRTVIAVSVALWAWEGDCLNIITADDLESSYDFVSIPLSCVDTFRMARRETPISTAANALAAK